MLADTYSTLPPNSQYAQDLKSALQDVLDKNPTLATDQTKEIISPELSPVVSQEISSEKVTPVTAPEYQANRLQGLSWEIHRPKSAGTSPISCFWGGEGSSEPVQQKWL